MWSASNAQIPTPPLPAGPLSCATECSTVPPATPNSAIPSRGRRMRRGRARQKATPRSRPVTHDARVPVAPCGEHRPVTHRPPRGTPRVARFATMERHPAQLDAATAEEPDGHTFLFAGRAGFTGLTEADGG